MPPFLSAELMYRPRPVDRRARAVFDFTFTSRVSRLTDRDTLLILADSPETLDSLAPLLPAAPQIVTRIVNPPVDPDPPDTPFALAWDTPDQWQKVTMTDRWARITAALETAVAAPNATALLMPAHDAVWGKSLLPYLSRLSADHAHGGMPAAVSPVTYWQHSTIPGAAVDPAIIALTNITFGRDLLFPLKAWRDQTQGFWGKMSLMPAPMAAHLLPMLETGTLEDDLVIDSAIRRAGFAARAVPILNPRVYRQALPVFDQTGLRTVIRRTLHYSLNAASPRQPLGGSLLTHSLDFGGQVRLMLSPRFRRFTPTAEAIIRDEANMIRRSIDQYGASWVDWGAYRIVVRVGEWLCEVWKRVTVLI